MAGIVHHWQPSATTSMGRLVCVLCLSHAALGAALQASGAQKPCYSLRWDVPAASSSTEHVMPFEPIQHFPAGHPKVTDGATFCGAVAPNTPIPDTILWPSEGGEECVSTSGAVAFYGYYNNSANTGQVTEGGVSVYAIVDELSRGYFIFTSDIKGRSSTGRHSVSIRLEGGNLEDAGVQLLLRDDPNDRYEWDDATASGYFRWHWSPCCTDGALLGPFPKFNYTLDLIFNSSEATGIDSVYVWSFNYTSGDVAGSFVRFPLVASDVSDSLRISVHGVDCDTFCGTQQTCSKCLLHDECGWVEGTGCMLAEDAQNYVPFPGAPASEILLFGQCCPACTQSSTLVDCVAVDGCGWCPESSQCFSGSIDFGACSSCATPVLWSLPSPSPPPPHLPPPPSPPPSSPPPHHPEPSPPPPSFPPTAPPPTPRHPPSPMFPPPPPPPPRLPPQPPSPRAPPLVPPSCPPVPLPPPVPMFPFNTDLLLSTADGATVNYMVIAIAVTLIICCCCCYFLLGALRRVPPWDVDNAFIVVLPTRGSPDVPVGLHIIDPSGTTPVSSGANPADGSDAPEWCEAETPAGLPFTWHGPRRSVVLMGHRVELGPQIVSIDAGSLGAQSGKLATGDIILAANGRRLRSQQLHSYLANQDHYPVKLVVVRHGLTTKAGRPKGSQRRPSVEWWSASFDPNAAAGP